MHTVDRVTYPSTDRACSRPAVRTLVLLLVLLLQGHAFCLVLQANLVLLELLAAQGGHTAAHLFGGGLFLILTVAFIVGGGGGLEHV